MCECVGVLAGQVQEAALREAQIRDGEAQLQISKLSATVSSMEQKLAAATAELQEERARRAAPVAEHVSNWKKVVETLRGTRYERYLED